MLTKYATFLSQGGSDCLVPLSPGGYNDHLVKVAAASPVSLEQLRCFAHDMLPVDADKLYALVSAMGASDYYGSNSNADVFPERALNHAPKDWNLLPYSRQVDVGRDWEWGYPTFYNAKPYMHHQNSDPNRAFGAVDYVVWDDFMKRVLLIIGFSRRLASKFGGDNTLRKIDAGESVAVSMGARLLFDLCSSCTDWPRLIQFGDNPEAILAEHRRKPIRGVSADPSGYCDHIRLQKNRILPSGVRYTMINAYPRFFDISAVYIGADKTSFVLAKLAGECPLHRGKKNCGGECEQHASHLGLLRG